MNDTSDDCSTATRVESAPKRAEPPVALFQRLAVVGAIALISGSATAASGGRVPGPVAPRSQSAVAGVALTTSTSSNLTWQGRLLSDLAVRWNQWYESIPLGAAPHGEPSGANCGISQSGPVWFLSGPLGKTVVNACTIPAGKAIMAPIFNVIDDYPCPYTFEPSPGQGLETFLTIDISQYLNLDYTTALLDGAPLLVHRVRTPLFAFTAAASNVANDLCITGSPQLAVSEGYYVFIDPPSRGRHVLQLRSGPVRPYSAQPRT
jgi:hypothetical protein